jgi:hypothetical protein
LLTCFQSCSLHLGHEMMWYPSSTHLFVTQTGNNLTDTT